MVNKFPRGERRTDEVENASWLWDPSRARLGLETVSRTTEEETDESGAAARTHGPAVESDPTPDRTEVDSSLTHEVINGSLLP